jgi:hypothetical protein
VGLVTWRTGRKVGRTIYLQLGQDPSDDDVLIGVMDRPDLAEIVVDAVNEWTTERPVCDGCERHFPCRHCQRGRTERDAVLWHQTAPDELVRPPRWST